MFLFSDLLSCSQIMRHQFSDAPSICDEYGLEGYLGYNWYVKFTIEESELDQISFHPCEKDMTLANGRTLTSSINRDELPSWRARV